MYVLQGGCVARFSGGGCKIFRRKVQDFQEGVQDVLRVGQKLILSDAWVVYVQSTIYAYCIIFYVVRTDKVAVVLAIT